MKKKNDDTSDIDKINEDISDVPDGGWGWIVVLSSFMCNVLIDGIGLAYGVLLPRLVEHFQATRSKVSLVGSLLLGTYFCTGPVAGGLVNKFGCRKITIVGSLVATVGVIIASLSPDLDILIVTYGLIGGVTNTIGRFLSAMIANIKRVNALVVLIIGLLIASVTVFLQPFCTVYPALIVFSVMYGLSVGGSSTALTSIILCDLLGVNKLAKSFGLLCFARGIACVIGPWLAGKVFQYTGNYDVSFYVSGGMFATGALLRCLILLPAVKQWTKSKDENEIVIES